MPSEPETAVKRHRWVISNDLVAGENSDNLDEHEIRNVFVFDRNPILGDHVLRVDFSSSDWLR